MVLNELENNVNNINFSFYFSRKIGFVSRGSTDVSTGGWQRRHPALQLRSGGSPLPLEDALPQHLHRRRGHLRREGKDSVARKRR